MISYQRKDRRIYPDSHCLLCGDNYGICQGEHRAHPPTECAACGTPQCWTNGMSRGQCGVCYIGLLNKKFGSPKCGYKGCNKDAIAAAPMVKYVCADHARTAKSSMKPLTVAEYVQRHLDTRDKTWTPVEFQMESIAVL